MVDLISKILQIDPTKRLNARGILEHNYTKNAIIHNKRRYKVEIYSRILEGKLSKEELAEMWDQKYKSDTQKIIMV